MSDLTQFEQSAPLTRPAIFVVGIGREGSSIVNGLAELPACVEKMFVTASPAQPVAESQDFINVGSNADWLAELESRTTGAKFVLVVAGVPCREAGLAVETLAATRARKIPAVALLVEPLLAGTSHKFETLVETITAVTRAADATLLALSHLHPPASASISEAVAQWNERVRENIKELICAAASTDALGADFADLAKVLSGNSRATIGVGRGVVVEEAIQNACKQALAMPNELETACSVLAYVTVGADVPLDDARRVAPFLEQIFPKAEVANGLTVLDGFDGVEAVIIAAKLDGGALQMQKRQMVELESPFFKVGDPTVYEGENLDVPAFVRKGVPLPGGPPRPVPEQKTLFESPAKTAAQT